ncbi:MAG: AraC family transcriptional regulator [Lachnospiraceae bacterium]
MILSFANKEFSPSFKDGRCPTLLTASNINVNFTQHPRILHNHDDRLELLFIRSGAGCYIVDDTHYDLAPGTMVVCNSGVLHDEVPQFNRELSMFSIAIANVFIQDLPENHLLPAGISPVLNLNDSFTLLDTIFEYIFESLAQESPTRQETSQYFTQALLTFVLHAFEERGESVTAAHQNDCLLLKEIKDYIDENYFDMLSLQSISNRFYISQSYLSHLFKRKLGYSPIQYILRRRIGEAQSLLVFSNRSITDIAAEVGFDSLSHFNVQFKKFVRLSPMSYRKKYILPEYEKQLEAEPPTES